MVKGKKKPFTLEVYDHFLHNQYDDAFTVDQLNEVIFMHGFKKIHKRAKSELYDALSTIDLMNPQRSTLEDNNNNNNINFSPYDSLDQVKQDLEALNWQECPVQSIVTVGQSMSEQKTSGGDSSISKTDDFLVCSSSFKISRKRRRSKRTNVKVMMKKKMYGGYPGYADVESVNAYDDAVAAGTACVEDHSSLFVDTYSWEF